MSLRSTPGEYSSGSQGASHRALGYLESAVKLTLHTPSLMLSFTTWLATLIWFSIVVLNTNFIEKTPPLKPLTIPGRRVDLCSPTPLDMSTQTCTTACTTGPERWASPDMWVDAVPQPFTTNESRLIIIGTVAKVKNQPKALDALNTVLIDVANRMLRVLKERKPYCGPYAASYLSMSSYESFGGFSHMSRLATNFVVTAFDIYFGIVFNWKWINEINIIACESGVYLVIKLIEFIDLYGDSVSMSKFSKMWTQFLLGQPISFPTQPDSRISALIRVVILIEPSLPVPSHLARWLGSCPCFYDQQLVAPKEDSERRMFLVCKTNMVRSTHHEAGVDGAESFEGDELTDVIQNFEKFINS